MDDGNMKAPMRSSISLANRPMGRGSEGSSGLLPPMDPLDARKFLLAVKRLADSLNFGTDKSPFIGSGLEYVQSRLYQPGDPIKSIDWRITARTGKLFVKEYEAPKRMPVYILFDTSASMIVASHRQSKYSMGLQIAGALALASLDRISPVGLLTVGSRAMHIVPTLSKDRTMEWLHQLRYFRNDEPTRLSDRISDLVPSLRNRVLAVVISDMHELEAVRAIKRLSSQHDCCLIQLIDPAERSLKGTGMILAREAESGRTFVANSRTSCKDPSAFVQEMKRSGVDHLVLNTNQPIAVRLRQFFAWRGIVGKGAR